MPLRRSIRFRAPKMVPRADLATNCKAPRIHLSPESECSTDRASLHVCIMWVSVWLTPEVDPNTKIRETAEARRTTVLQPVEQKPHSQKDRQDEKAEGYVPDERTR